jgi:hypothetical protein
MKPLSVWLAPTVRKSSPSQVIRAQRALQLFSRRLVTKPPLRWSLMVGPLLVRAVMICGTVALGCASLKVAIAPATWGAAIEVPPLSLVNRGHRWWEPGPESACRGR